MRKIVKIILVILITCWFLYSLLFQVRRKTGDDASVLPVDPMEVRASNGDFDAIKILRQRYVDRHQFGMADYWLYKGALYGESVMTNEYLLKFRSMSEKEKQAELQSIRTSTASQEQKDVLLKKLTDSVK
ncbi:hypothetical protein H8L32_00620 [Undibacterium sp. CY18W]|uniref:Uncharacterized protein n=1 Tax=Undibacterium hunanense TaxID=2762292 RepID=A0ABR6ZK69_9BURK|nr:hypothetical protein [Undibacterium hunanense]MBC3915974.1 hypothetical protein [Undibacterium hunanense]